jgi:hypothetical protein
MTDVQSDSDYEAPAHNAERGRPDRLTVRKAERRRRKASTISRMASFKLDVFDASQLDTENYVYRWVNEEGSRLRMATKQDDYDYVDTKDLKNFDAESTDSESTERVRMFVEKDKQGNPVYAYLLRKPRDFWEEDQEAMVRFREDMMDGVVYRGEGLEELAEDFGEGSQIDPDAGFYVPPEAKLGSASARRRGPIKRNSPKNAPTART